MESALSVRFLAVSGKIWIGDTPLWYDFTLVEYHVYIDEVSWLIFSVLGGASDRELGPEFFKTLNPSRKDTWDFHKVAWSTSKDRYDVARPYEDFVLPIFDTYGNTLRTQRPFENQWTHVRVHQHAAAVFAEEKKICFLLPLIVQSHKLLPATPVFWKLDDDTIPLARTTMWPNQQTVEWLASTGEWYPPELRSELLPRIEACRGRQQPRKQPPEPPKPTRWWQPVSQPETQPATHVTAPPQAAAEPPAQAAKASQKSPRQEAQKDQQYIKLAKKFAQMIAKGPQTADAHSQHAQASASNAQSQTTASPQDTPVPTTTQMANKRKESVVTAQELTEKRPEPPTPTETVTAKMDTPGTGELSHPGDSKMTDEKPAEHSNTPTSEKPADSNEGKPQEGASPTSSPTESSETIPTEPAVSSPSEEPRVSEYPSAVAEADLPTLKCMRKETRKKWLYWQQRCAICKDTWTASISESRQLNQAERRLRLRRPPLRTLRWK